jgi:hypothetical protein
MMYTCFVVSRFSPHRCPQSVRGSFHVHTIYTSFVVEFFCFPTPMLTKCARPTLPIPPLEHLKCHPLGQVMTLMATLRSRERVRLTAFNCFEGDIKSDGREIRTQMHNWVDVTGREGDRDVAAKITSNNIHIIIDMSGIPDAKGLTTRIQNLGADAIARHPYYSRHWSGS